MNIVHCIFTMETGGAQMLVVDMLNAMCRMNTVSLVIVNREWDNEILDRLDKTISIYYIRRKRGSKNPLYLFSLNYLLYKLKPEVVHCHESNMINFFLRKRFKTILTVHDVGIQLQRQPYDQLVAISGAVAQDLSDRYKIHPVVVYNGVHMNSFLRKEKYSIFPTDRIKIIQVSRLMHQKKGQDILIEAISRLINDHHLKNIEVDFIGDGNSYDYLTNMVQKNQLQDHIHFLGNQNRTWIAQNLQNYHILVQPSRYEGFGLTIVEGIAAGLPVISSDLDGPSEILRRCEQNFLFEAGDINNCAARLLEVIELYKQGKMKTITASNYDNIKSFYSLGSMIENYLSVYDKVLTN